MEDVHESALLISGKMFKSLDLPLIVEFMLMFYKDKPIDWLLDHIMWVKVCNPEKDAVRIIHLSFLLLLLLNIIYSFSILSIIVSLLNMCKD